MFKVISLKVIFWKQVSTFLIWKLIVSIIVLLHGILYSNLLAPRRGPDFLRLKRKRTFSFQAGTRGRWKENWLGVFQEYPNGWIYQLDLGWCYASPDRSGNVWLWINDHGWVWTNGSTWPHLYRNQTSSWIYLLIRQSGPAVFFDQMHGSFMHLNK